MEFRSSRRVYAIVLLLISGFFMCATFVPFLYSVVFPNEDLQGFVSALEGQARPPQNAEMVVQQAIAAAGTLNKTVQIGASYQTTTNVHNARPQTSETIKVSRAIYVAWFEKHPDPMIVELACYASGAGQKAYRISEGSRFDVVRGYAIPVSLFGFSLFLARKRKSPASAQVK